MAFAGLKFTSFMVTTAPSENSETTPQIKAGNSILKSGSGSGSALYFSCWLDVPVKLFPLYIFFGANQEASNQCHRKKITGTVIEAVFEPLFFIQRRTFHATA